MVPWSNSNPSRQCIDAIRNIDGRPHVIYVYVTYLCYLGCLANMACTNCTTTIQHYHGSTCTGCNCHKNLHLKYIEVTPWYTMVHLWYYMCTMVGSIPWYGSMIPICTVVIFGTCCGISWYICVVLQLYHGIP